MQNPPSPQDPRYVDWLVKLAEKNLREGIIEEPRLYYDFAEMPSSAPFTVPFTNNVFRNGEQFPVRITHMIATIAPTFGGSPAGEFSDERLIQHVALRMRWHDTDYMSSFFMPLPLWSNKVVGGAEATQQGSTSWVLDRPLILSARDSLRVQTQLVADADDPRNVMMAFSGIGLLSKRPYLFGSSPITLENDALTQIPSRGYINDGAEPVAITDLTTQVTGVLTDANPAGDARRCCWGIRQIGNGTQSDWLIGPNGAPPAVVGNLFCPGSLLGISTGRSIVHRFPGDGIVWEPGEGIQAEIAPVSGVDDVQGCTVYLGFAGYISVQ